MLAYVVAPAPTAVPDERWRFRWLVPLVTVGQDSLSVFSLGLILTFLGALKPDLGLTIAILVVAMVASMAFGYVFSRLKHAGGLARLKRRRTQTATGRPSRDVAEGVVSPVGPSDVAATSVRALPRAADPEGGLGRH